MTASFALARVARRSIVKAPLRSLLVVVLIALLVAVGTGFAIVMRTATATGTDVTAARFGAANTLFTFGVQDWSYYDPTGPFYNDSGEPIMSGTPEYETAAAEQAAVPPAADLSWTESFDPATAVTALEQQLDSTVLFNRTGSLNGGTWGPFGNSGTYERFTDLDTTDPLAEGLFDIIEGRAPTAADDVALNPNSMRTRGLAIGDDFDFDGVRLRIVGVLVNPSSKWTDTALVTPAGFDRLAPNLIEYQVRTPMPAPLDLVAIRETVEHIVGRPVNAESTSDTIRVVSGTNGEIVVPADPYFQRDASVEARLVPILVSAVLGLQVALVSAAAFAVGVRRRTKEFGQLLTTGADTNHLRRLMLFEGGWLGAVGALVGVALGVAVAWLSVDQGWVRELGDRYVTAVRWNPVDWIGPAIVGVLAALAAAWWPSRLLSQASTTAALAGHLPAGRPGRRAPRWGLLIVLLGSGLLGSLAISLTNRSGEIGLLLPLLIVGTIAAVFVGALMMIGTVLSLVGSRADRLPLLARLVVRNSDRQRSRAWMVVGAFVALIVLPTVIGASIKAYPNSYANSDRATFEQRLVTTAVAPAYGAPDGQPLYPEAPARDRLLAFDATLGQALTEVAGPINEAPFSGWSGLPFTVETPQGGYGFQPLVIVVTPEVEQLLALSPDVVDRLGETTMIDISANLYNRAIAGPATIAAPGGDRVTTIGVDIVTGPTLVSDPQTFLVSPDLAGRIGIGPTQIGTLRLTATSLTTAQTNDFLIAANELWVAEFGPYVPATPDTLATGGNLWGLLALRVDTNPDSGPSGAQVRLASLAITGTLAALIAFVTASLSAVELDAEIQSMIATGAAPLTRRLMLGAQTLYHLVVAAVFGVPLAVLLFFAVSRADDYGPPGVTIPWTSVAMVTIVLPIVVGGLVTLVFRNGQPAISRRLS